VWDVNDRALLDRIEDGQTEAFIKISHADYLTLSETARKRVQHCVLDSSETLVTGPTLRAP
jgi:hypothetical protein